MSAYSCDGPVLGPAYVGRELLLRNLGSALREGRSLGLIGGPKMGRTSTLLHVQAAHQARAKRLTKEGRNVPVYVDLGAAKGESSTQLAERVWKAFAHDVRAAAVQGGGAPPAMPEPNLARSKEPFVALGAACAEWAHLASGTAAWCRHTWLLDNVDALLDGKHDDATAFVGSALRREVEGGPSGLLLAGGRKLREAALEKSHVLAGLRIVSLGVLSQSDAELVVKKGLPDLATFTKEELLHATGRHPFALQAALLRLHAQGGTDDLSQALGEAKPLLNSLYGAIWGEFDLGRGLTYRGAYAAPEHALMQLLVDAGAPTALKAAEGQLGIASLREFGDLLEYVGVVERTLRGDAPLLRAHFRLWNEWYSERIRW